MPWEWKWKAFYWHPHYLVIIRAQCAINCPQILFLQREGKFTAPSTDVLASLQLAPKYKGNWKRNGIVKSNTELNKPLPTLCFSGRWERESCCLNYSCSFTWLVSSSSNLSHLWFLPTAGGTLELPEKISSPIHLALNSCLWQLPDF